jgi:hypothetical protein
VEIAVKPGTRFSADLFAFDKSPMNKSLQGGKA